MPLKQWHFKDQPTEENSRELAEAIGVPHALAKILLQRGISSFDKAMEFFHPALGRTYDPFLMDGMEKATTRVIQAVTGNEKMMIYGDYDVDGICSTSLLYMFLSSLGASIDYYIPHRINEGYGISQAGIDYAKKRGVSLMLTVDCGITAVDQVQYANNSGLDVIILDHHKPKETLPAAYAILDPLKPECKYPFKSLSATGIAYKFAMAFCSRIGKRSMADQYLDLVALAGAADIVPLLDENRILVNEGLKLINQPHTSSRIGLNALIEKTRLMPEHLTTAQLVYSLAPRINAVGRLGDAKIAVELLVTKDRKKAEELSEKLESENTERRKIDEDTLNQAVSSLAGSYNAQEDYVIVLHGENWHAGVIAIVASRIVEKYNRPTIMLTTIDGMAKGSARSLAQFNIYEALKECEHLLVDFGGHEAAAGLSVELDKLATFRKELNEVVRMRVGRDQFVQAIDIDSELNFDDITPRFLSKLEELAPFGPGNLRPVFLLRDVEARSTARIVGNNHLYMKIRKTGCERVFEAIGFDMGEKYLHLFENGNERVDIAFVIDQMFAKDGHRYTQFRLRDIRPAANDAEIQAAG